MQSEWGIPWNHIYDTWTYPQFGAFADALIARLKERAEAQAGGKPKAQSRIDEIRARKQWR